MRESIIPYFASHSFSFRRLSGRLRAWLLRETYALPLDLFRVLVGLLCLAYFVRLLWEVRDFSSPDGLLDHVLLLRIFWFTRLSVFHPGLGASFFYGAFGLACLGALGIVLGYRVKLCAGILYVIAVSTYRWNFIVMYVDDAIMHLLLFWLLILPVGRTLTLNGFLRQRHGCLARWSQVTVPGTALRCFLGNVCLVYLVAGLWKFESPLWRQGFALYASLRLPIAYAPDFWGQQHLLLLQVANYIVLGIEPLLPFLLTLPPGHFLKWLGLLGQLGLHLGIIATMRVPFANVGLLASSVLFFGNELMGWRFQHHQGGITLRTALRCDRTGRIALALLLVLTLAMLRRVPIVGEVHKPAYALLWMVGIAQDYQLFNWIDRKNYHVEHHVTIHRTGGAPQPLASTTVFPSSLRFALLQSYVHGVRWMPVPWKHRHALQRSILQRSAHRFCRLHATSMDEIITIRSAMQRIRPDNVALTRGRERFLMRFRCSQEKAVLCGTFLDRRVAPECRPAALKGPHASSMR